MNMNAVKVLSVCAVSLIVCGCAATLVDNERQRPTHRWVTPADVPLARYNFDNTACKEQTLEAGDQSLESGEAEAMRRSDPRFAAYEQCMESKGYELATY